MLGHGPRGDLKELGIVGLTEPRMAITRLKSNNGGTVLGLVLDDLTGHQQPNSLRYLPILDPIIPPVAATEAGIILDSGHALGKVMRLAAAVAGTLLTGTQ